MYGLKSGILYIFKYSYLLAILYFAIPDSCPAREKPIESPRAMSSDIYTLYLPSFNPNSVLPLHDNFSINGKFINLFVKGPNLNFYYGLTHGIKDGVVIPEDLKEITSYIYTPQSQDDITGRMNFSFLDFFQINTTLDYLQNKVVFTNREYSDYNFNKTSLGLDLTYDDRYSSLQTWYQGMVFIYPEEGCLASIGTSYNSVINTSGYKPYEFYKVYGRYEQLFHPYKFWVIDMEFYGESHLKQNPYRAYMVTSDVLGTYEIPGDYYLDGSLEIRFLYPGGIFWESPAFWYIASFLFKFSPGFAIGYDGGFVGKFNTPDVRQLQSVYLSPLVAIRMNGDLLTVVRLDVAFATSQSYNLVLSLNFGTIGAKSGNLYKQGL